MGGGLVRIEKIGVDGNLCRGRGKEKTMHQQFVTVINTPDITIDVVMLSW